MTDASMRSTISAVAPEEVIAADTSTFGSMTARPSRIEGQAHPVAPGSPGYRTCATGRSVMVYLRGTYVCATMQRTHGGLLMATKSTSFRLGDEARQRLHEGAEREGVSATALLERLIIEGVDTLDHPGIVYRGPDHDRRAALAAGPDVWEVVARLRELDGSEEERIETLSSEIDLHPRQIRTALEFAARHPEEIERRIARNEQAIAESREAAEQRRALLA